MPLGAVGKTSLAAALMAPPAAADVSVGAEAAHETALPDAGDPETHDPTWWLPDRETSVRRAMGDPLAEDIRFRELMGLDSGREHIAVVQESFPLGEEAWLPFALSPSEAEQVDFQMSVQGQLNHGLLDLEEALGPGYAGISIEHREGAKLKLRMAEGANLAEEARLRSIVRQWVPSASSIEIVPVDYPLETLEAYSRSVREYVDSAGDDVSAVHGWGVDIRRNRVVVAVDPAARTELGGQLTGLSHEGAIEILPLEAKTYRANRLDNSPPLKAGLGIRKMDTGQPYQCTSNIPVRQHGGPVRLMTAGHCEDVTGGLSGIGWRVGQQGPFGKAVKNAYFDGTHADVLLVSRDGTAVSNCVYKTASSCIPVSGSLPYMAVGGASIMSTVSGDVTVGEVGNPGGSAGLSDDSFDGVTVHSLGKVDNQSCVGDSGAPVFKIPPGGNTALISGVLSSIVVTNPPAFPFPVPGTICGTSLYSPWGEVEQLGITPA